MRRLALATAALASTFLAGAAMAQDWRAAAEQDLTAAHAALRDNHPAAVVDQDSAAFRSWLDAGLAEARERLSQVNSPNAYAYVLRAYGNGFRDSNIELEPSWDRPAPWEAFAWPNFATAWRDGGYVVSWVKEGARRTPPLGATLVSCDGVPAEEFAARRLDGFEGDLQLEADRVRTAPYLFWDRGNPFDGSMPSECQWRDGRRNRTVDVRMEPATPADREAAYRASVFTPSANPLTVEAWNGGYWISVNSLSDSAPWDAFLAQLEQHRAQIQAAPNVVLDLRGADGSSLNATAFGYRVINRLWTPEFVQGAQPSGGQLVHRATPANRQWFADTLGRMQADLHFANSNPGVVADVEATVAAYDAAIAAGQPSFTRPAPQPAAAEGATNPMQGRVIVLTDGGCTGGCLALVDVLKALPNVQQAGSATGADSIFIEPTVLPLPSNYGRLSYGHKAWIGRPRGSNEPHVPAADMTYTGNATDEAAVRAWVASRFGG